MVQLFYGILWTWFVVFKTAKSFVYILVYTGTKRKRDTGTTERMTKKNKATDDRDHPLVSKYYKKIVADGKGMFSICFQSRPGFVLRVR